MSTRSRIQAALEARLPLALALLRSAAPVLSLRELTLVSRFRDVQEVLSRPDVFGVPYAEKMREITGGGAFFLGMDDSPTYSRDVSNMRVVIPRTDVEKVVRPLVERAALEIVASAKGQLDVVQDLTRVVPARFVTAYLGVPGPSREELIEWATVMFHYLFYPSLPEGVEGTALQHAAQARHYLDQRIAQRRREGVTGDDVLARCLRLQSASLPGMADADIRNNLLGLLIGAIPTTSKCAVLVLDYLLDHPQLLVGAQHAARAQDRERLLAYVLECLRLKPFSPGVFRVAREDYRVASGTLRSKRIRRGSRVLALTQSAMLDGRELVRPGAFRLDRPAYHYMPFGYGMHSCFGEYVNRVQIPAIVGALLRCEGLRRAPGAAGEVEWSGPFPRHWTLEFDAPEWDEPAREGR